MSGYETKILEAIQAGTIRIHPGTLQHVTVLHDDDCALLDGGDECDCDAVVLQEGAANAVGS